MLQEVLNWGHFRLNTNAKDILLRVILLRV